ncbi:MAG: N-acetylmuramoyl-L-alanine amidase, partial [Pseudomonadota bacterium]
VSKSLSSNRRRFLGSAACGVGGLVLGSGRARSAEQTKVTGVYFHEDRGRMKLHLDLNQVPQKHKVFVLENPQRIVIDLAASRFSTLLSRDLKARGTVRRIRYGKRNTNDLRIVLDVNLEPAGVSSRMYQFKGSNVKRLVVDLGMKPVTPALQDKPVDAADLRDIVIAIDAGHGGKDPGAIGHLKTQEKDVTLKIARELEKKLKRRKGFKPFLIRKDDRYLPLAERVRRARAGRADLLISIHADAFPKKSAHGSSVFALSTKGASSRAAELLAETENQADKLFGEIAVGDSNEVLSKMLIDLAQNAVLESSIECGSLILKQLGKVNTLHKEQVEQAGFAVLRAPDVPSLLVETAFISNPKEERKLRSRRHQRKLASAIAEGVVEYFMENAPPDSVVASLVNKQRG